MGGGFLDPGLGLFRPERISCQGFGGTAFDRASGQDVCAEADEFLDCGIG